MLGLQPAVFVGDTLPQCVATLALGWYIISLSAIIAPHVVFPLSI